MPQHAQDKTGQWLRDLTSTWELCERLKAGNKFKRMHKSQQPPSA